MNDEISNKLFKMFNEISLKENYEKGCSSDVEKSNDETNLTKIYSQKFIFGKNDKKYEYKGYVITNLNDEIIESKYELIKE